jgi:hypothetical protein
MAAAVQLKKAQRRLQRRYGNKLSLRQTGARLKERIVQLARNHG